MDGVFPGEKCRPAGCAKGLSVVAVEDDAVVSQSVDVRRRNFVAAMETYIIETLKIKLKFYVSGKYVEIYMNFYQVD